VQKLRSLGEPIPFPLQQEDAAEGSPARAPASYCRRPAVKHNKLEKNKLELPDQHHLGGQQRALSLLTTSVRQWSVGVARQHNLQALAQASFGNAMRSGQERTARFFSGRLEGTPVGSCPPAPANRHRLLVDQNLIVTSSVPSRADLAVVVEDAPVSLPVMAAARKDLQHRIERIG